VEQNNGHSYFLIVVIIVTITATAVAITRYSNICWSFSSETSNLADESINLSPPITLSGTFSILCFYAGTCSIHLGVLNLSKSIFAARPSILVLYTYSHYFVTYRHRAVKCFFFFFGFFGLS
jgi:hypothetical protein